MTLAEAKVKWDTFIQNHPNCCKELLIPRSGSGPLIANASAAEFERAMDRTVADGIDELRRAEEAALKNREGLSSGGASRPGIDPDPLKDLLQDRVKDAAHPERASER
jgi:hypothetical protein